jgi:hypothetical protein
MAIKRVLPSDGWAGVEVTATGNLRPSGDGNGMSAALLVAAVDASTGQAVGYQSYSIASNQNITSGGFTTPVTGIAGGSYVMAISATAFNGATIKLQTLLPDGVTWADIPAASVTANTTGLGVVLGANSTVRLAATGGAPTGVYATLS